MKSLYLDMNIYNRPFDDQSEIRIRVETLSVFSILQRIRNREFELLWSFILDYENSMNPSEDIRTKIEMISTMANKTIFADNTILQKAKKIENRGVKARDALHVASAIYGDADFFITCDDRLIKKTKGMKLDLRIMNPIEFEREIEVKENDKTGK